MTVDAPKELGSAGKALWDSTIDRYELEHHEELVLLEAARVADRLDALAQIIKREDVAWLDTDRDEVAVNPALVEARQQQITLTRLIASLRLPEEGSDGVARRPQRRGPRGAYGPRAVS